MWKDMEGSTSCLKAGRLCEEGVGNTHNQGRRFHAEMAWCLGMQMTMLESKGRDPSHPYRLPMAVVIVVMEAWEQELMLVEECREEARTQRSALAERDRDLSQSTGLMAPTQAMSLSPYAVVQVSKSKMWDCHMRN